MRRTPYIWLAAVMAALAVLVLVLREPRLAARTTVIDRGAVEAVLRTQGVVRLRERYTVVAPFDAVVPALPQPGSRVRAGEPLIVLQPAAAPDAACRAAARDAVDRAQAKLESAQAVATSAHRGVEEFTRLATAAETPALHEARAQLRSAEFAVAIARHELDMARLALARTEAAADTPQAATVRTPASGVVLSALDAGHAMRGETLLVIGDPATLEIRVDVTPADAMQLETGTRAQFHVGETLATGSIIHPQVMLPEQRMRQVVIQPDAPRETWPFLRDGDDVDVALSLWRNDDALRVPLDALYREEDRWMVFRVRDGRAYATPVGIGRHGEQYAEIADGIAAGDVVILQPGGDITDGMRVDAQE